MLPKCGLLDDTKDDLNNSRTRRREASSVEVELVRSMLYVQKTHSPTREQQVVQPRDWHCLL